MLDRLAVEHCLERSGVESVLLCHLHCLGQHFLPLALSRLKLLDAP
jgi:hypothetical protein